MSKNSTRPVHEIRMGSVKATIWANDTAVGSRNNVTISRIYRENDEWRQTDSFGRDHLPLVAKVVDQAHSWIFQNSHPEERQASRSVD